MSERIFKGVTVPFVSTESAIAGGGISMETSLKQLDFVSNFQLDDKKSRNRAERRKMKRRKRA